MQMICGLAAIGKVYVEALIIAYGNGRNGKSTFWNAISKVLGLYSGNISADTLTVGCRRNIKPEMAEVKGKRLLIAAEMQEGARLNDSTVKQLCSTDDVFAEKKYKDPFSFKPCHTLVLYTNQAFIFQAAASGKSNPWCWVAAHISGCTNQCSLGGRNLASIHGIPDVRKRPSGNLINQRKAVTIRP